MFLLSFSVAANGSREKPQVEASFAPGTPKAYIDRVSNQFYDQQQADFNVGSRWYPYSTAFNSGGYNYGDGVMLTWSIMPDGTNMPGYNGEPTCASSLRADMDAAYGAGNWESELESIFAEWSAVSGIEYVYEAQDDGAAWPYTYGAVGVRGDIRIGGCNIDGDSGILAYNFFPDSGDMKIDSTDIWFTNSPLSTGFHNVVAHENGHGLGVNHVCPFDHTKLLEPWVSQSFVGPQLDDIRASQHLYGDVYENLGTGNDTAVTATDFGFFTDYASQQLQNVSLDNNIDEDWYQISVGENKKIDVTLTPVGEIYEDSDQSGGCPAAGTGPFIDAGEIQDLSFEIIAADGTTVLYAGDVFGLGEEESVTQLALGLGGDIYIRVFGEGNDDVQLYDLAFIVQPFVESESEIDVSPAAYDETLEADQQIVQTLIINNSGTANLAWHIDEDGSMGVMCDTPDDIAWVTLSQTNGSVAPNDATAVDIMIDSANLDSGSYEGVLCVDSNDPTAPMTQIPIMLTIPYEPPAVAVSVTHTDLLLSWFNDTNVGAYEVHRDPTPYFTPQSATQQTDPQLYDDTWVYTDLNILNNLGGGNFYYAVRAIYPNNTVADRSVAIFQFDLVAP